MILRIGRKNGHTIYRQANDEPSDDDQFLGAFDDPDIAEEVVDAFNEHSVLFTRVVGLEQQLREMAALAEQRAGEIQRLQRPLMTDEQKADTEAAFQRGVNHARESLGTSKYALNRDGIMLVGKADQILATALHAIESAQAVLGEGVAKLSTDAPAADADELSAVKLHNFDPPTDPKKLYAAVVTPEEVAAQAPDEADDGDPDCRCHLAQAICRKHDVGR